MSDDSKKQGVRVSIITLTWNHLKYTKKAVDSILPILKPEDEMIFVDNFSDDGTLEYLEALETPCPKHILFPPFKCGIGKAYNLAFEHAKGEYVFIYDNDLEIKMPETLDSLINTFFLQENVGIVCPCCDNIIGRIRSCKGVNDLEYDVQEITQKYHKPWPELPSAAWLIRNDVLKEVGLWDEQFDPYGIADYDYAKRVLLAGFRILVDRSIFVKHYGSITANDYISKEMMRDVREKFYNKWGLTEVYSQGYRNKKQRPLAERLKRGK